MTWYNDLIEHLDTLGSAKVLQIGAITGLTVILVLFVTMRILKYYLFGRRRGCKGLELQGPGGTMFVTAGAVKDFTHSVLKEIPDIVINQVQLQRLGRSYAIKISILPPLHCNLIKLREDVEQRVLGSLKNHLGIEVIDQVNIDLKGFNCKKGASDAHLETYSFHEDEETEASKELADFDAIEHFDEEEGV